MVWVVASMAALFALGGRGAVELATDVRSAPSEPPAPARAAASWPALAAIRLAPFPPPPPPGAATGRSAAPLGPSRAVGRPEDGRLVNGRLFPAGSANHFTWDNVRRQVPNRAWRRYGTERLIQVVQRVLHEFALAHPTAARVGVGDLSRPRGGPFGTQFGGLGHATHQNGLDADVYYPRRDRREVEARRPAQVDRALAQDLVNRFVRAGAQVIYVGPSLKLRGPSRVVVPLVHHDDHLHVRIRKPRPPR